MALDLPGRVLDTVEAWQGGALRGRAALRTVGRAALHVTLCFLGDQPADAVPELAAACSMLTGASVAGLALGGSAWLPRHRPRVLVLRVEDDRGELREAQGWLAGVLARTGHFVQEARLFFPHVTVARVRAGERVRASQLPPPEPIEFRGETVTLYRSHTGAGPARYEALSRVLLAQP